MRRSSAVFGAWIAFLGCGGSNTESPATTRDGGPPPETETAAASCAPIAGTAPFAVRLAGSGAATDSRRDASGTVYGIADVYFPSGRVAGGEVVFVTRKYSGRSAIVRATLDATLSARGLQLVDSDCRSGVSGDLIGPTGGIAGVATNNLSAPSDALETISGPIVMCASGEVPAQKIEFPPPARTTALDLPAVRGARPFASTSFAAVSAMTTSGPVALKVTDADPGALIAAATHFSWSSPTTIDLSGLRDVLGAPLGLGRIELQVPTAAIADLTFATAPPAGVSVGSASPVVSEGKLVVGRSEDWNTAIAIGSASGTTRLRLRHRLACAGVSSPYFYGSVVSVDGTSVVITPRCGASTIDETVTLPGPGPFTLLLGSARYSSPPCNYPSPRTTPARYEADELAFE